MLFTYSDAPQNGWSIVKNKNGSFRYANKANKDLDIGFNPKIDSKYADVLADMKYPINKNVLTYTDTSIGFNMKSGVPYISAVSDAAAQYNRHCVFATFDLTNKILCNIRIYKGSIYLKHIDTKNNALYVFFSLNPSESRSNFYVVTKNESGMIQRTQLSIKLYQNQEDQAKLVYRKEDYKSEADIPLNRNGKSVFNANVSVRENCLGKLEIASPIYRPKRPSVNVICCVQNNIDDIKKILAEKFKCSIESKKVNLHTPDGSKELKELVEGFPKDVQYVTYYLPNTPVEEINSPNFVDTLRINYFAERFNHLSVITREGELIHLI